jgi:hypothetical protein
MAAKLTITIWTRGHGINCLQIDSPVGALLKRDERPEERGDYEHQQVPRHAISKLLNELPRSDLVGIMGVRREDAYARR